ALHVVAARYAGRRGTLAKVRGHGRTVLSQRHKTGRAVRAFTVAGTAPTGLIAAAAAAATKVAAAGATTERGHMRAERRVAARIAVRIVGCDSRAPGTDRDSLGRAKGGQRHQLGIIPPAATAA